MEIEEIQLEPASVVTGLQPSWYHNMIPSVSGTNRPRELAILRQVSITTRHRLHYKVQHQNWITTGPRKLQAGYQKEVHKWVQNKVGLWGTRTGSKMNSKVDGIPNVDPKWAEKIFFWYHMGSAIGVASDHSGQNWFPVSPWVGIHFWIQNHNINSSLLGQPINLACWTDPFTLKNRPSLTAIGCWKL